MGCDCYTILTHSGERDIRFSEGDDDLGCLCTFPHNDGETLDADRVRSLAYLGAAVVLASHEEADDNQYLPNSLPEWIRKGIDEMMGKSVANDVKEIKFPDNVPNPNVMPPKYMVVSEGGKPRETECQHRWKVRDKDDRCGSIVYAMQCRKCGDMKSVRV